jgi:hypothetical protein
VAPCLRGEKVTYLQPNEYENYGIEKTTLAAWAAAASSLIDAHCRRATLAVANYTERQRLRAGRSTCRLTYLPLATVAPATTPITAARGRYAVPRRGEGVSPCDQFSDDVSRAFSLPGTWTTLDPATLDFDPQTGEITIAPNPLGFSFNEIELTYNAGFATIPDAVKFACAQIVRNAQATPALNVRSESIDRLRLDYFSDSLLDASARSLLAPFVAQKLV